MDALKEYVVVLLTQNKVVELVGLGAFKLHYLKPTKMGTIRSNEIRNVPGRYKVRFVAGRRLAKIVRSMKPTEGD